MKHRFLLMVMVAPYWMVTAATPAVFQDYQDFLVGSNARAFVTADVNNDGNTDLVIGTSGGTVVMLGKPDGTFAPPIPVQPDLTFAIAVADFNGDGKLDIVSSVATNGSQVNLALGNGDGTFGAPRTLNIGCTDCYLAAVDLNGDGRMDLAVANTSSLVTYLGTGRGNFVQQLRTYPLNFAAAIAAADVNNDGKPDLVVTDFGAQTEIVFLADARLGFTSTSYPSGSEPFAVVLTDLNGDGLPDMVSVDRTNDLVLVRLNKGKGSFGPQFSSNAACPSNGNCTLEGLTAADFNKDGKMDIATPGGVLYGNGNGTFQPALAFASGSDAWIVASGDFNHDGYPDLAVGNGSAINISVLFGGLHPVTQPQRVSSGGHPHAVATGDFNRDGKADLAVASHDDGKVDVYLNNGSGGFIQAPAVTATTPGAVIAKDLNGDGKLDLAISGDAGTWIYLGNGDGTFTLKAQYSSLIGDCTPWAVSQVAAPCFAAADLNNDGIPDLAGAVWIDGDVSIMLGNGDGTFRAGQTFVLPDTPQSIATGDFNKDGKMDLAISSLFGAVYIYQGNGAGTFGAALKVSVSSNGAGLAVGDVNGDGNLDLVLASGSGGSYIGIVDWVVTGKGDGTFNTPISLLADEAPNAVVLDDFNGDGLLDIASVNFLASNVTILINTGNLTFLPETLYGSDTAPATLVTADLNGDGKRDLVVANEYSSDVTILLNTAP